MRLTLFVATILSVAPTVCAAAADRDAMVEMLVQEAVERAGALNPNPGVCTAAPVEAIRFTDLLKKRETISITNESGTKQKLSVLNEKEANEMESYIRAQDRLAFGFTEDGCVERALESVRILRSQGIAAGMLQASFDAPPESDARFAIDIPGAVRSAAWKFHVVTAIAVRKNGKVSVQVLDPALSTTLMTKTAWEQAMRKRATPEFKTNFDYLDLSRMYNDDQINRANAKLLIYREAQKQRQALMSQSPKN